jgi:hypothetical protein
MPKGDSDPLGGKRDFHAAGADAFQQVCFLHGPFPFLVGFLFGLVGGSVFVGLPRPRLSSTGACSQPSKIVQGTPKAAQRD